MKPAIMGQAQAKQLAREIRQGSGFTVGRITEQGDGACTLVVVDDRTGYRHTVLNAAHWQELHAQLRAEAPPAEVENPLDAWEDATIAALDGLRQKREALEGKRRLLDRQIAVIQRQETALESAIRRTQDALAPRPVALRMGGRPKHDASVVDWVKSWAQAHDGLAVLRQMAVALHASGRAPTVRRAAQILSTSLALLVRRHEMEWVLPGQYRLIGNGAPAQHEGAAQEQSA